MSDYNPPEGGEPSSPDDGPDITDVGEAFDDGQTTEPAYEEPKNYLDVDEVADRYVRVKVDGEDQEVPLKEALSGYSRTADYTRKTQELAQQRQQVEYAVAVQRALQAQPEATIRLLAEQYGINQGIPSQSPPPQQQGWEQPSRDDGDDDLMDPLERRLNQQQRILEQLSQANQEREAQARLQSAIGGLQRKYQADDSIVREVVGTALQARMGPESFEMIYKNIAYDREQAGAGGGDGHPTGARAAAGGSQDTRSAACRQRAVRQFGGRCTAGYGQWTHVHPRSLRSCPQRARSGLNTF